MNLNSLLSAVASYARRYSDQDPKPLITCVREQAAEMRRERHYGPRVMRTSEERTYRQWALVSDRRRNGIPFRVATE